MPNPRLVKIHRNYSVEQIVKLLGVHENTVRGWFKQGLRKCDARRPTIVLGPDLREFLEAKRKKHKRTCKPGEIYCVRCRAPKVPAGGMADYEPRTDSSGMLVGICPDCDAMIYQRAGLAKLVQIRRRLEISCRKHVHD